MSLPIHNRGKHFEMLFKNYALHQGLRIVKNDLSCRVTYQGGIQLTHTELDFTVVKDGRVGFFDAKESAQSRFAFSKLNKKQVDRAASFNRWGVPSGFVVWFRTQNRVELLTGYQLAAVGHRKSIAVGSGVLLGKIEGFDLTTLFDMSHYKPLWESEELPFIPEPAAEQSPVSP